MSTTPTTTMTLRISKELKDRVEQLAAHTKRSKSYLAAEAITEYVDLNAWQVEAIGRAVAKADAGGPSSSDEDANAYLDALRRGETCAPKARQSADEAWKSAGSTMRLPTSPRSTVSSLPMIRAPRRASSNASRRRSAC